MKDRLNLKPSDLPMEVVLTNGQGERRVYTLRAAGRKFGALLCAVERPGCPALPNQGGQDPAA